MQTLQLITIAVIAIGIITTYIITKSKGIAITNSMYKIVSGVLAVAFFVRYFLDREAFVNTIALEGSPLESKALTAVSLVLFWIINALVLVVALYPYYKQGRVTALIKYFGTVATLLAIVFVNPLSIGQFGNEAYSQFNLRTFAFAIELGVLLAYCVIVLLENGKLKSTKDNLWGLVLIIPMLIASLPSYMISALFGYTSYTQPINDLELPHRILVYGAIVIPIIIYEILKGRDKQTIRGVLIYICLATLMTFSTFHKLPDFKYLYNWPLHLCNTAMYIIPICLLFNMKKTFYFTYFINVLGAFIAILMPSYGDTANLLSYNIVRFFINHYIAFFMPILLVVLGVFERPKLKQFKYSMIAFAVYFVSMLVANAWGTNYKADIDFFFLNSNFVVDKLGTWAENIYEFSVSFQINDLTFVFYPLYQAIFFAVYVAMGAGVWFLYEGSYSFIDTIEDIRYRKSKIRADRLAIEYSQNKHHEEKAMNSNTTNQLVLTNFSKQYASSKVFAVRDASITVNSGDIFGFLGHNGAGKSTIIKSIVGIQPITSGSISVCGYDVDKQSVMAKKQIGFVPDHYALYEKLTGREYLNYIADLYDVSQSDRDESINYYVDLFKLQGAIDNQIKTYSHGMKQKVTIMSALIHNPKLWILDEPLTGLDPESIYQVKECMRHHAAKGNIVFFSSHLIDIVETVCNRIAIIARGNILTEGSVQDIISKQKLEDYYREITEKATSTAVDANGNLLQTSQS